MSAHFVRLDTATLYSRTFQRLSPYARALWPFLVGGAWRGYSHDPDVHFAWQDGRLVCPDSLTNLAELGRMGVTKAKSALKELERSGAIVVHHRHRKSSLIEVGHYERVKGKPAVERYHLDRVAAADADAVRAPDAATADSVRPSVSTRVDLWGPDIDAPWRTGVPSDLAEPKMALEAPRARKTSDATPTSKPKTGALEAPRARKGHVLRALRGSKGDSCRRSAARSLDHESDHKKLDQRLSGFLRVRLTPPAAHLVRASRSAPDADAPGRPTDLAEDVHAGRGLIDVSSEKTFRPKDDVVDLGRVSDAGRPKTRPGGLVFRGSGTGGISVSTRVDLWDPDLDAPWRTGLPRAAPEAPRAGEAAPLPTPPPTVVRPLEAPPETHRGPKDERPDRRPSARVRFEPRARKPKGADRMVEDPRIPGRMIPAIELGMLASAREKVVARRFTELGAGEILAAYRSFHFREVGCEDVGTLDHPSRTRLTKQLLLRMKSPAWGGGDPTLIWLYLRHQLVTYAETRAQEADRRRKGYGGKTYEPDLSLFLAENNGSPNHRWKSWINDHRRSERQGT